MSQRFINQTGFTFYVMKKSDNSLTSFWVNRNSFNAAYENWAQSITDVEAKHVENHLKEKYNAVLRIEELYDHDSVNWKFRQTYDWKIYFQDQEDMLAFILEWS